MLVFASIFTFAAEVRLVKRRETKRNEEAWEEIGTGRDREGWGSRGGGSKSYETIGGRERT